MLAELLELEKVDAERFITRHYQESFRNTLFGGQVLAQALVAAGNTVDERPPHSLHAYFLRAGVADSPIEYQVETLRDGRSVSSREVKAIQNDKLIFSMSASFHQKEPGFQHQHFVPYNNITPETLKNSIEDTTSRHLLRTASRAIGATPIELVPYDHAIFSKQPSAESNVRFWVRSGDHLGQRALTHYAALAFASDIGILATSLLQHNASLFEGDVFPASMDHSLWFHAQPNFQQWHQYFTSSPWAGSARALCQGALYDQSNQLVASVTQEGLIRPTSNS